jgi:hypothetical protein
MLICFYFGFLISFESMTNNAISIEKRIAIHQWRSFGKIMEEQKVWVFNSVAFKVQYE